jgi:hypothetical protein
MLGRFGCFSDHVVLNWLSVFASGSVNVLITLWLDVFLDAVRIGMNRLVADLMVALVDDLLRPVSGRENLTLSGPTSV